jgi:hypothetical protein
MYVRGYLQGSENGRVVTIAQIQWSKLCFIQTFRPQTISAIVYNNNNNNNNFIDLKSKH